MGVWPDSKEGSTFVYARPRVKVKGGLKVSGPGLNPGWDHLYLKYLDIKSRNQPTCSVGRDERDGAGEGAEVTEPQAPGMGGQGEDAAGCGGRRWLILSGLPLESSSWPVWAMGWQLSKSLFPLLFCSTSLCQEDRDRA